MTLQPLSALDIGLAALLLVINAAISIAFRLGLERTLAIAAVRMIVQLLAVGLVLQFVLAQTSPLWTILVALVMIAVAGFEVAHRQRPRFTGLISHGLGAATLLVVGGLATAYAVGVVIAPDSGFAPRYVIPILGMVLGNTLTAVALALATLTDLARRERTAIEARIALGATRRAAFGDILRRTLETAMMPIVNAMSIAGLVTLPGMMTGQILAGVAPSEAAMYQIMILCVISGAAGLGAVVAALAGVYMLSDGRHRLRLDRLAAERR